jgi:hypothetical protein
VPALGEPGEDGARVALDAAAVARRDAEVLERDALTVQHAEHVMIGDDEERRGIAERLVVGEPRGIGVAVRAHDGEIGNLGVQPPRDRALAGLRREQSVGVKCHDVAHRLALLGICWLSPTGAKST